MNKGKRSIATIFLGLYLVCIGGLFWFSGLRLITHRIEITSIKYQSAKEFLKSTLEAASEHEFKSEAERENFKAAYTKAEKYYNAKKTGPISPHDWLVIVIGLVTAIAYIFSGILLLRGFKRFKRFFKIGSYGFVANYFFLIIAALCEVFPLHQTTMSLLKIFYPKEQTFFSLDLIMRLALFHIVAFGISYGFYVILPKVIIRRSKAIRELG